MTIYYTYRLIHRDTRQFYIGSRCIGVDDPYLDLGIKYKSSSKKVKQIGFENFYYGVIDDCFPDAEMCAWSEQLMIFNNLKDPLCLNGNCINPWTGESLFQRRGNHTQESINKMKGRVLSAEIRAKISENHVGMEGKKHNQETRKKMSASAKARPPKSAETRKKLSISNSKPRKPLSEETKRKISDTKRRYSSDNPAFKT